MSIQFGRWTFEGKLPAPDYIEKVNATLAPYGPDSNEQYSKAGVRILYRAFHTTKESHRETQPHISSSGAVITWDGRLDNRAELISEVRTALTVNSTDVEIVAAAYDKWGSGRCLAKLIGDWAVSIYDPTDRSLVLAKDPIGMRTLYYSLDTNQVTWSTILDPIVLFAGKTFAICKEYIAGWFSHFPATHLTPYTGIHSVPPSSFVLLRPGKHVVSRYWDFRPSKKTRYGTDGEYEEHFRSVFATAVQRRLRSDRPVLAELSGGMDSSSIVCVADTVIARDTAECLRLDTISWYADGEPDLDERSFFTKVEEKRGGAGFHIDLASLKNSNTPASLEFEFASNRFAATPIPSNLHAELFREYAAYMRLQGHRVVLSGIGGDEVTGGGVPTPTPELQDLLLRANLTTFIRQLNAWAAKMRTHRFPLLWEVVRGGLIPSLGGVPKDMRPAPWFCRHFVRRNRTALCGYPFRLQLLGPLPSFQDNIDKLGACQRFVAYCDLRSKLLREVRFPYLDRDLLEFMYSIPREQVVRVGQRRSLMKRALVGIVPDELLKRKRTAVARQEPRTISSSEWSSFAEIDQRPVSGSLGFIDSIRFREAWRKVRRNQEVPTHMLMKTRTLEFWLRHLLSQGVLTTSRATDVRGYSSSFETDELRPSAQPNRSVS
jgi:asparagine synthase (glutamine-hydrolysing)